MKILVVSTDYLPNVSGVATLTYEEAVGLLSLGHEVQVFTTTRHVDLCEITDVRVRRTSLHGPFPWRMFRLECELSRVVSEWQPDLIWCTTYRGFGVPILRVARRWGLPYGIYFHGTELITENRLIRSTILRGVAKGAQLVATNSLNSQKLLTEFYGVNAEIITPGVHIGSVVETDLRISIRKGWLEDLRAMIPEEDLFVFICACRLTREKGIDQAIKAIADLPEELRNRCIYVVVGDGLDNEALRNLSQKLGLANQVYFAGALPRSKTATFLAAADVYLQPSQPVGSFLESFGISFLEAQAVGLPCVSTRFGGIPEAIRDGETGLLVEPGSDASLLEALTKVINSSEWRTNAATSARKWAGKNQWIIHNRLLSHLFFGFNVTCYSDCGR